MTSTLRIATEKDITRYMVKGRNILLVGDHGIGKTTILKAVCAKLGWKMVVFNGATMDAYIDLVGIPEIVTNGDKRVLEKIRQEILEDADVVFIDEINRGNPTVLNGTMEMVNEGSINGVPLPNLKCVVAAINPVNSTVGGSYMVSSLDPAQMDRFDVTLGMSNRANPEVITKIFVAKEYDAGECEAVAKVLCRWQNSLDFSDSANRAPYVSPRKVVQLGIGFLDFRDKLSLIHCLGDNANALNVNALYAELTEAVSGVMETEQPLGADDPFVKAVREAVETGNTDPIRLALKDPDLHSDIISAGGYDTPYHDFLEEATRDIESDKQFESIYSAVSKSINEGYKKISKDDYLGNDVSLGYEDAKRKVSIKRKAKRGEK